MVFRGSRNRSEVDMSDVVKHFFKKMPIKHVWLFLTEKCQLSCDYCFFQDREEKRTISWKVVESLLKKLSSDKAYDIVLSGGEPLLVWEQVVQAVEYVRSFLPQSTITIQTNGLLLDIEKVLFLKKHHVVVEPGIDGLLKSNIRHRKTKVEDSYECLLKNIHLLKTQKMIMNPTMTVHPKEVGHMIENYQWLIEQGLSNIEVHPAFLSPWQKKHIEEFRTQYSQILMMEMKNKTFCVGKGYSIFEKMSIDLIVLPSGDVLPNWTYLTFSQEQRSKFVLMQLLEEEIVFFTERVNQCLKELKDFFIKERTYRQVSCFHAERILRLFSNDSVYRQYLIYKCICYKVQRLDQKTLAIGKNKG